MNLRLYNTLSRNKEIFNPAHDNIARIYSCGPTVYSRQHIGNMRAAVFSDILKRTLRYNGYEVKDVVNITDVGHLVSDEDTGEDKLEKAAREAQKNPYEIARHYEELYLADLKKLNIILPRWLPRATEHIEEQINFISALEKKGLTYRTDDGVYFDTGKLANYGKLSRQPLKEKEAGARVAVRNGKRSPRDFALWKFLVGEHEQHAMRWESPWGVGFPGWHIECSAMGRHFLGEIIDIHTGGIEHIPIHHENEIAQNEGSGKLAVRFWIHNEHLLLNGGKMSKSLGNILSLDDLATRSVSLLSFRYWLLTAHYRSPINFTWKAVEGAQQALSRLARFMKGLVGSDPATQPLRGLTPPGKFQEKLLAAINDDLNTPQALAALWDIIKDDSTAAEEKHLAILDADRVLGLGFSERADDLVKLTGSNEIPLTELPPEISELLKKRETARLAKNWEVADRLRDELLSKGYRMEDTLDGLTVTAAAGGGEMRSD